MLQAEDNFLLIALVVAFIVVFGGMLIIVFSKWLIWFRMELRCLNSEIGRTVGEERRYWIRRRRELWFSILPFVQY